jgi:hypothetical protein
MRRGICLRVLRDGAIRRRRRARQQQRTSAPAPSSDAFRRINHQFGGISIVVEMPLIVPNTKEEQAKDKDDRDEGKDTTGVKVWPSTMRMCEYLSDDTSTPSPGDNSSKWTVNISARDFIVGQCKSAIVPSASDETSTQLASPGEASSKHDFWRSLHVLELGSGCGACGILGEASLSLYSGFLTFVFRR